MRREVFILSFLLCSLSFSTEPFGSRNDRYVIPLLLGIGGGFMCDLAILVQSGLLANDASQTKASIIQTNCTQDVVCEKAKAAYQVATGDNYDPDWKGAIITSSIAFAMYPAMLAAAIPDKF